MLFRFTAVLLTFLLLTVSFGASAQQSLPLDAHYVLDPAADRTFEEIQSLPESAWTKSHNQSVQLPFWHPDYWTGAQGGVLWLRVEIPAVDGLNRLWLELLPNTGIDGQAIQFQGNQWNWIDPVGQDSSRDFHQPARYLTFVLDTDVEEKTVYFRLTTAQVFGFTLRATPVEGLLWQFTQIQFFLGLVIGMVILAICYNLSIGIRAGESVFLRYSLFVFCNLLYLFSMSGLFRMLSPDSGIGPLVANTTSALAVITSYHFVRGFLNTAAEMPRIDRWIKGVMLIFGAFVLLSLFSGAAFGYFVSITIGIVGPLLVLLIAVVSFRKGHPLARYFLIAWSTYLLSAGAWGWMWLGLVEPKEQLVIFFYLGTLLEVVLLSIALGFRFSLLKNRAETLDADKSRYETLSRTDELTGLLNRRGFTAAVRRVFEKERPVHLVWLALDVDHFKQFNDTHGHLAGDQILKGIGQTVIDCSRTEDIAGRIGGEEFTVLLVGCPLDKAKHFTDRLLQLSAEIAVKGTGGNMASTTLSIGATAVRPEDDLESVWGRADDLLYAAKEQGRNRAVFG